MPVLGFLSMPQGMEWIIILAVMLLIFGKNLPSVGRNLGKGIVEFKKGLKGVRDEMDQVSDEVRKAEEQARLDADRSDKLPPGESKEKIAEKTTAAVAQRTDPS